MNGSVGFAVVARAFSEFWCSEREFQLRWWSKYTVVGGDGPFADGSCHPRDWAIQVPQVGDFRCVSAGGQWCAACMPYVREFGDDQN